MIPNFALALSFESIALLRRTGARWARIEEVPIDHDDLDACVVAMRDRAETLDPKGAQVAVVIPNEQIRYLDVPEPTGSGAERNAVILKALENATPYAVSDLVHDHVVSNGTLQIAAVARETLNEAEDFARDHGFVPVCHLAQAPDGVFDNAVFFGRASDWSKTVFRPARAVAVVPANAKALEPRKPAAALPEPVQPGVMPEPSPDAEHLADAPLHEARPEAAPAEPLEESADALAPEAVALTPPLPPASPPLAATYEPHLIASLPPLTPPEAEPDAPDLEAARLKPLPEAPRPEGFAVAPRPPILAPAATSEASSDVAPAAPLPASKDRVMTRFTPMLSRDDVARDAGITSDHIDDLADTEAADVPVVFSHAMPEPVVAEPKADTPPAVETVLQTPVPGKAPTLGAARPAHKAAASPPPVAPSIDKPSKRKRGALKAPDAKPAGRGPGLLRPQAPTPAPPPDALPVPSRSGTHRALSADKETVAPPVAPAPSANPLARLAALRSAAAVEDPAQAPDAVTGKAPKTPTFAKTDNTPPASESLAADRFEPTDERDRMTVFGARGAGQAQVGGKPRFMGLMLTSGLLMFLAGIAAWASVFRDDGIAGFFRSETPATAIAALPDVDETAVIPPEGAPIVPDVVLPLDDTVEPETTEPVEVAALDSAQPMTDAPDPPALAQPLVPRALTPEEAETTYAATGIWQRAPGAPLTPPTDGLDGIYQASIDPGIRIFDAVALPDLPGTVAEPVLTDPGLPPPAGVTFDIDERGVVRATPQGALTPDGLRVYAGLPPVIPPLRDPPAALATPDTAPAPDAEGTAAPQPISPLAAVRPEARPTDIVEQRERATLQGISVDELRAFRPQARPRTAQEDAALEEPDATVQAVRASLVPVTRPRSMAAIVRRAEETRPAEPVQTAAAATVAPRTVQPNIPSSANVARAATVRNAISLNKVSLIGVYGTPANRRALVRLASGRYVKVQVGDRLDGGRVAAIDEGELRYTKRGRNVTIQMPRG